MLIHAHVQTNVALLQSPGFSAVTLIMYCYIPCIDPEAYLESKGHSGVELTDIDGYIQYIKIMLLLYADDTVLISESNISLQNTLDDCVDYCNPWKLKINEEKTKVIVFGSRIKMLTFTLGNSELEIVDS